MSSTRYETTQAAWRGRALPEQQGLTPSFLFTTTKDKTRCVSVSDSEGATLREVRARRRSTCGRCCLSVGFVLSPEKNNTALEQSDTFTISMAFYFYSLRIFLSCFCHSMFHLSVSNNSKSRLSVKNTWPLTYKIRNSPYLSSPSSNKATFRCIPQTRGVVMVLF